MAREPSSGDIAYIHSVMQAVRENNVEWIAKEMIYPVVIGEGDESIEYSTAEAFLPQLKVRLTKESRKELLEKSKEPLFANSEGIMVGDGHLWIEEVKRHDDDSWDYGILAIGLFAFQVDTTVTGEVE